ncbi:MAG TPA: vWA domain-containing protein, partial [Kofleriaceae bacterium]
ARYFRVGKLTAKDYVEAAVLLTAPEDQGAAFEVARELLFPKDKVAAPAKPEVSVALEGGEVVSTAPPATEDAPSVLDSLAGMNLDLGALDLDALDRMLDEKTAAATEMRALDLLTNLSTSDDPAQRSLAALATSYGGAAELEGDEIHDESAARRFVLERLLGNLGSLEPGTVANAAIAGFANSLEGATVWEQAGLHAARGEQGALDTLLDDLIARGNAKELGRSLAFVRVSDTGVAPGFQVRALASARHLADWAEILDGLGEFVEPPDELVTRSARENVRRALHAASVLDTAFTAKRDPWDYYNDEAPPDEEVERPKLRHTVFDAWAGGLAEPPTLDLLVDLSVPTERWAELTEAAFGIFAAELDRAKAIPVDDRMVEITRALHMAKRLRETKAAVGRKLAGTLATRVLMLVGSPTRFLPLLDAVLDIGLAPDDVPAIVAAGAELGIAEEEIFARLAQPLEQLRFLIEGNVQDLRRYIELVDKITFIPDELLQHLLACCVRDKNRMGLALLLAVALGPVLALVGDGVPQQLVDDSLNYRGIGGGENLLLQWFEHRDAIPSEFKTRVRALAKQALLDAALVWVHKGSGGGERGLIPQTRSRPFRAGDELDHIDIDGTLEALAMSGKSLEEMSHEDLLVQDTSSGRAGFGVLIYISGSMSGKDLAICAIAVVMLLGRLRPDELALALFESDTHVVKEFASTRELDEVADELLDLRATGGTRVDAALRFIHTQFVSQPDHERRVFFLLSDFAFFESSAELAVLLDELADLDLHFIGAGHGY